MKQKSNHYLVQNYVQPIARTKKRNNTSVHFVINYLQIMQIKCLQDLDIHLS